MPLSAADAVPATLVFLDETGFLQVKKSVGVQRQYSGTAGRIENGIGVFLAYASARGRTLLDRELYLPQVWAEDWERRHCRLGCRRVSAFGPSRQLAQLMLKRALESGVPFGWVAGDEVYGNDRKLRRWLERAGIPHVLAHQEQRAAVGLDGPGPVSGAG